MYVGLLTGVRLLADAIASALTRRRREITIVRARSISEFAVRLDSGQSLDLVIVDAIAPLELDSISRFHAEHPQIPLLALGLRSSEDEVIVHGGAGFSGYISREDGIESLNHAIEDAIEGRLNCPPEIAAAMMRALFQRSAAALPQSPVALTRREHEVARLVSRALSNKEIARELRLSESTVKHHVHAILGKFGVARRSQLMRNLQAMPWASPSHEWRSGQI